MASFWAAHQKTLKFEGGYVNDSDDVGGETYKGISRKFNPMWDGWKIIDQGRNSDNFPVFLDSISRLQSLVASYYKQQYWDKVGGDTITAQSVAEELFDTGVNMGVHRAVAFLQRGLNVLNRNQQLYPDLVEDGMVGPKTLGTLITYLTTDPAEVLLRVMVILRGSHYLDYMKQSPTQEKFARGWLNRLNF